MNDTEQARNDDGAGPAASDDGHFRRPRHTSYIFIVLLFISLSTQTKAQFAQDDSREALGLSVSVNAGAMRAANANAQFYSGEENNANTIYRVLHSQQFGTQIWDNLTEQNLITSAITTPQQITIAEYGTMTYLLAVDAGIGFRYGYPHGGAWLVHIDYTQLNAVGQFLINSGRTTGILTNQNAYVSCPIAGVEVRTSIDFGVAKKFRLQNGFDIGFALGGCVNNTKVQSSDIQIAGVTYSILDVWGGESPSTYSTSYEYINQGGIGYGGFGSLTFSYTMSNLNTVALYCTCYYVDVNLKDYDFFNPQYTFGLRFDLGNFSFWS